ncbi:BACON domain-containing protein [Arcticibacter sp.]|uniref:BACON domain-containing protein n=1 Tax=Arcticibacter sp. TaxID=1872630 RepID=UPI00388D1E77
MKKIFFSLLTLLCIATVSSCKKQDALEEKLLAGTELIEAGSKAGSYYFDVLSNVGMVVETDVDWITLDSAIYPKGKRKITFRVVDNQDDERSGVISVRVNADMVKQVLVTQESGKVPVFYVSPEGNGEGDSWNSPTDFATALDKATTGSTIYMMEGTYYPSKTIRFGEPSEESDNTFEISKNVSIIGGYSKDAMAGASPNAEMYKTILQGNMPGGKQAFHTVTVTANTEGGSKVYIEGLTITGGNATDRSTNITINGVRYSRGQGGGILIGPAQVHLKGVNVTENKATADKGTAGFGAGLYAFSNAVVVMENCKVNNNQNTSNNGGGVWINAATLTAYNSQFNGNSAKGTAGGVHGYPGATIHLYNSEVMNNSNTSYGAGLYMRENSNVILVNCLLTGNKSTSPNGGGAVMLYDNSKADIISCTITANEVAGPGAGVYRRMNVNNLTVVNSVISGNKQASTSTDIDAFTDNAAIIPVLKNSAISGSVYGDGGTVMGGLTFNPATMLSSTFTLTGANNPALSNGLNEAALAALAQSYTPALEQSFIIKDKNNASRVEAVMGALIK